jgi:hypothetical protein
MLELLVTLGLIIFAIGFALFMVRGVIQMWRHKDRTGTFTSAIAGALSEFDRAVRPSVEHVIEAKDSVNKQEDASARD